ncbi:hypothetical protein BP6252_04529 [Coleophoma cylindrospora]|uniref:Uncharacterized protein n=1 Tax=Coleophoma cylindrospora TaxID=1849047 RepID=A0A3D8S1D2_9HELO|nr:hypothetical protein BP6252_04529 [Coleophoma cylindrospora]
MSHIRRAGVHEREETTDDEDLGGRHGRARASITTDEYIQNITGTRSSEATDSDVEFMSELPIATEHKTDPNSESNDQASDHEQDGGTIANVENTHLRSRDKGKRKAGVKIEFSDDDGNTYENFKNRKALKRKKTAVLKKKLNTKLKAAKDISARGEGSKNTAAILRDDEDYGFMEDDLPEYIQERRKEFDTRYLKLQVGGLRLPPSYDDMDFSDDEKIAEIEERPIFPESIRPSRPYEDIELPLSLGIIPASIAQYLRDYQVKGVEFMHELFVYQRGGILGDDMGLGKTVQVAAFLTAVFGKTGDIRDWKRMRKMRRANPPRWYPRVMVICPGSLIENWKAELGRWGWWHVEAFHGDRKDAVYESAQSGRLEILVTTYTTYKLHKDRLNLIAWDCVVADECHQLKERNSETTQAMNDLNALCRIGLTGTAIQNKYEELWTLLNWTNPGRFGPISTWKSSISDPLRIGQSHDATNYQLKRARETAEKLVKNLLPQFFLRRMKTLIAHQLPKKTDRVVFCPLTEIQRDAYTRYLDSELIEIVKYSADPCECGSGKKRGRCCYVKIPSTDTKWQALVFPAIITLQKLSNHLALMLPNTSDPQDKQARDLETLKEMLPDDWRKLYENRDSLLNLANPKFCGKWAILKKLLAFWHGNGDKVLIFSHSVKLLRMLEIMFRNTSYNVSFLSGELSYEERQRVVDDFNSDPNQFVFLISTKAGGVGLNITSANKVVIMDPNWNPSYDLQAQDRAYRIGQLRDVEVFRLISVGTVEETVYARQIYKQQQANIGYTASLERRYFKGVQNTKDQQGEIFGLRNLLTFHDDDILLQEIINKTNVAEAKAGVRMADVDMDDMLDDDDNPLRVDDDDGNGAMSQLAAFLGEVDDKKRGAKSRPKQSNPIQAILASAGVQYTHENSEVVGSSKVEAQLSRRAGEAGNDIGLGDERLFAESQPEIGGIRYIYHPPEEIMMRQFCSMAKTFGFASATEFALVVEGWTQKQRTDCLNRFYQRRNQRCLELSMHEPNQGGGLDTELESDGEL